MGKATDKIKVSVMLPTYHHEAYIRQALDSILAQDFAEPYEILVGDDCSPDNTQSIIREYMEKYPGIVKGFLRKKNVGGKKNSYSLMKHCRGEYIAFLEGDDYWCDSHKLTLQAEFLDTHPEYIACCHKFNVVDRDGKVYYDRDFQIQFVDKEEYTLQDFEEGKLSSHFNSLMYRNIYADGEKRDYSFWYRFDNMSGDATMNLILALKGRIYCMPRVMSCYRKVIDADSTSFSAMQEKDNRRDRLFLSQLQMEQLILREFGRKVSFEQRKKNIFASAVFKWYREKNLHNFKVVCRIVYYSRRPLKYTGFAIYLVAAKKFLWLKYKEDRRVPF